MWGARWILVLCGVLGEPWCYKCMWGATGVMWGARWIPVLCGMLGGSPVLCGVLGGCRGVSCTLVLCGGLM